MPLFGVIGERIGYQVYAHAGGGPPILLIHGLTASSASFVSNLTDLQRDFTVVTVDLLGHGESDAPPDTIAYEPGPAVERITGLMDALGYDSVLVCGHSLGGALALRLALDCPGRVAGLVVINSNSAAGTPQWRDDVQPRMAQMAARLRAEGPGFLKNSRLYPAASRRLPEDARQLLERDFDRITPEAAAGTFAGLVAKVNAFERYPALDPPLLVVIGDRDSEFVKNVPLMLAQFPPQRLTVVTLEGAGHAANLEQPAAFHAALTTFARAIGYLVPVGERLRAPGGRLFVVAGAGFMVASLGLLGAAVALRAEGGDAAGPGLARASTTSTATIPAAVTRDAPAQPRAASTAATVERAASTVPSPATAVLSPAPEDPAVEVQPAVVRPPGTPAPAVAAPSPEPSPAPAEPGPAAPGRRRVSLQGPSESGLSAGFGAAPSPLDFLNITWSASGGALLSPASGSITTVTFPGSGCYTVTATALFPGGASASASQPVAVSGATC